MNRVFELTFEKSIPFKDKITMIKSVFYQDTLNSDPEQIGSVLNKTRLLLETKQTRLEGLLLLNALLSRCSSDVFVAQGYVWMQLSLQILKGNDGTLYKGLACSIINNIMKEISLYPTLRNEVANNCLPSLLDAVLSTSTDNEWISEATRCLASCMKNFPLFCGLHRENIEEFLIKQFDSLPCKNIEFVAECFCCLPLCCDKTHVPDIYSKSWHDTFLILFKQLQIIYSYLFDAILEGTPQVLCSPKLNLLPASEDPCSEPLVYSRRFQSVCRCLAKFLSSSSFPVNVPVNAMLQFVYFPLSQSPEVLTSKGTDEAFILASILSTIQTGILIILESLILNFPQHLAPHGQNIVKMIVYLLSSTCPKKDHGASNCSSVLRRTAFKVLKTWSDTLKSGSIHEEYRSTIVVELLKDLQCYDPSDTEVKIPSSIYKGSNEVLQNKLFSISLPVKKLTKGSACIEAIEALLSLLNCGNDFLSPNIEKLVYETVIEILFCIQRNLELPPFPYADERNRVELYKLLLSTILTFKFPLLLHPAQRIFSIGCQDSSVMVSRYCQHGIAVCNAVIHPQKSSMHVIPKMSVDREDIVISNIITTVQRKRCADWQVNNVDKSPEKPINSLKNDKKMYENHLSPSFNDAAKQDVKIILNHDSSEHEYNCNDETSVNVISSHENVESAEEVDSDYYPDEDDDDDEAVEETQVIDADVGAEVKDYIITDQNSMLKKQKIKKHDVSEKKHNQNNSEILVNGSDMQQTIKNQDGKIPITENGCCCSDEECIHVKKSLKRKIENSREAPAAKVYSSSFSDRSQSEDDDAEDGKNYINMQEMLKDFYPCSPVSLQS